MVGEDGHDELTDAIASGEAADDHSYFIPPESLLLNEAGGGSREDPTAQDKAAPTEKHRRINNPSLSPETSLFYFG